jgi:hypothetical protein
VTRHARLRTTHTAPAVVAAALAPDNTASMTTRVEGDRVVTDIERETTGGLQSSVDDYVVNVSVADTVAQTADRHTTANHE